MKKVLLLSIVVLFSCSNDDTREHIELYGNWNWISSSGGITGETITPLTSGENRTIQITPSSIKSFINGTLEYENGYTIFNDESILYNEQFEMIVQDNGLRQIFELNGDNLILIQDCYDCYRHNYSKE